VSEAAGVATFAVTLSPAINQAATVQYAVTAGTATAGVDFTPSSGTLTFPPASGTRTLTVPIAIDALDEDDETFTVTLSAPTGANIGDGQAVGTIADDDPLPTLSVSDCAAPEGDAGSAPCTFTFVLAPVSGRSVSVGYATASGTATSGGDFSAVSGALTIAAGSVTTTVSAPVLGDVAVEPDEDFTLALSGAVNTTLAAPSGRGIVLDDDAASLSSLELTHGSRVRADLTQGTADFYRLGQAPAASYEVVLDEASGDAVPGLLLEHLDADNVTVLRTALVEGTGTAASLRFGNPFPVPVHTHHLRVRSAACGTACGPDDTYRLRVYETTLSGSRFNNGGGQTSVVVLHNATDEAANGLVYFWSQTGALLHRAPFVLNPRGSATINAAGIGALAGYSGSLTVVHAAPYGGLGGKVVALEPATGFSFDTPLLPRPR
jgi:hypothetical protein